jgi:DNA-binding MarR family transcriptional regulator
MNSVFNTEFQHKDLDSKIVVALERLSQVFHNLLWSKTKEYNLSPIQIKFLIFILTNNSKACTVTELGRKFNLTKPTVSDAIAILVDKKLVQRKESTEDKRTTHLHLTKKGKEVSEELISWADPIRNELNKSPVTGKLDVYLSLLKLIESLERAGVISVNRMCITCCYFVESASPNSLHYCKLLEKNLSSKELRIDCLEHEAA